MVYYQAGIGTYTVPEVATPFMAGVSKTLDMMIAWNLNAHVMAGYEFLMQNYEAGDKICLLGFSRGAYTARALAGMVHKVGLLPADNHQQVPFAYQMFSRTDDIGWAQSTAFKKAFSIDVDIEFIGVWDTVNAVGLIPRRLPFTSSNSSIRTFRHAISLDERRAKFQPNFYNRPTADEDSLGTQPGEMPKSGTPNDDTIIAGDPSMMAQSPCSIPESSTSSSSSTRPKRRRQSTWRVKEATFDACEDPNRIKETDVQEVWFSGCHCDVGGGSVENSSRHNLARISLRWMIRQCFLANTGIRFHADLLRTIGLDPASLYPAVADRPPPLFYTPPTPVPTSPLVFEKESGKIPVNVNDSSAKQNLISFGYNGIHPELIMTEEEEDVADAICPIYDQLSISPSWWILELVPIELRRQNDVTNEWVDSIAVNLGRAREIPRQSKQGVLVHRSVKIRMEAGEGVADGPYTPRAKWKVEPIWVD